MQSYPVGNAGLKVRQLTVLPARGAVLFASGGMVPRLERCGMSESTSLYGVRILVTEALRAVNDIGVYGPPDLHVDFRRMRHELHSALRSIDRVTDPDPSRRRLAARA